MELAAFSINCKEIPYTPTIDELYSTLTPPLVSCDTFAGSKSEVGANTTKNSQCKHKLPVLATRTLGTKTKVDRRIVHQGQ